MHPNLFTLLTVLLLTVSGFAQERNWSDDTGKFSVDAKLIEINDGIATLLKNDGEELKVPLKRLSDKDQKFILQWQKNQKPNPFDNATENSNWLEDVKAKATAKRESDFTANNNNNAKPDVTLEVIVSGRAAKKAISFGMLKIDKFKDGKGNDLKVDEKSFGRDIAKEMDAISSRGGRFFSHPLNGFRFEVKTKDKSEKVKTISELSGEINVLTGGVAKIETIKNVSKHAAGPLKSDLLKELDMTCDFSFDDNTVNLKMEGNISCIASMKFIDKNGKQIEPNGQSTGGWDKNMQYSFSFQELPMADLVIEFRIDAETVTLPFSVKNVKIKTSRF